MSRMNLDMNLQNAVDGPTSQQEGEEDRTYIGRLQRENAELRKSPELKDGAKEGDGTNTDKSQTNQDKSPVNANLTQEDLGLNTTESEVASFSLDILKAEIVSTGSVSQNSLDVLGSALKKGLNDKQSQEVKALVLEGVNISGANTVTVMQGILGDIDYKTDLKPWAKRHARGQEWAANIQGPAYASVLRDMVAEYKADKAKENTNTDTNTDQGEEDKGPTSMNSGASGGTTLTNDTAEGRGFWKSRVEKSAWFRENGAKIRTDKKLSDLYDKLWAESKKQGTI